MLTEFDFELPRGYVDEQGVIHASGTMRLATAADEAEAVGDPRVQSNEAYLPIVLLSRVVVRLGELKSVTPRIITALFASDLLFLEDMYLRLNGSEQAFVLAECPACGTQFKLRVSPLKE